MIPKLTARINRPCRWPADDIYNDPEICCVFLHDDETGYRPQCMCPQSLYKSRDDRRDRPCSYNLTREECCEVIMSGVLNI